MATVLGQLMPTQVSPLLFEVILWLPLSLSDALTLLELLSSETLLIPDVAVLELLLPMSVDLLPVSLLDLLTLLSLLLSTVFVTDASLVAEGIMGGGQLLVMMGQPETVG